jgi:uncharacterized OB-fold protein
MTTDTRTNTGTMGALDATIAMPYTLTTGPAAGQFLAELANRRIVGSRCPDCGRVVVPAQDFCGHCHGACGADLVEVPATGVVTAITQTPAATLAFVRLDGTGADFLHRIVQADDDVPVAVGARVEAVWAEDPTGSVLDLAGFRAGAGGGGEVADVAPLERPSEPIPQRPDSIELKYRHAYGPFYGRLFDELKSHRRIVGSRCPRCSSVLLPPRAWCDICHVRTTAWADVGDTGVLKAFSVIHLEFVGQLRPPPYIYAEIVLDGASTKLIHMLGGVDPDEAPRILRPGMKVVAVWKDPGGGKGTLEDISHFELAEEQ